MGLNPVESIPSLENIYFYAIVFLDTTVLSLFDQNP
jgi:hypothetical protein